MTRYDHGHWLLAVGVSVTAGYVDAIGFLTLGGLFVSFMSGNSTRMAVGIVREPHLALVAAGLLLGFVTGVIGGSLLGTIAGVRRKPVLLAAVGTMLMPPAAFGGAGPAPLAATAMTLAMGAANTIFRRDGEVSIGVTYMTGTLVKFGQHVANTIMGGARWTWVPYLLLWSGLVAGGVIGATVYPALGTTGLWGAVAASWLLAVYALRFRTPD